MFLQPPQISVEKNNGEKNSDLIVEVFQLRAIIPVSV